MISTDCLEINVLNLSESTTLTGLSTPQRVEWKAEKTPSQIFILTKLASGQFRYDKRFSAIDYMWSSLIP